VTDNLQVGSMVIAKRTTGVCDPGEPGVCYEVYTLNGRFGFSFIFRGGRYKGFSPDEIELLLTPTGQVCDAVADYEFRSVARLCRDYQAGRFRAAFEMASRAAEAARNGGSS
jgi:hypothetical protein